MKKVWGFGKGITIDGVLRAAPKEYALAKPGDTHSHGMIGEGFGGEPLVCLMDHDDGQWFIDLIESVGGWYKTSGSGGMQ